MTINKGMRVRAEWFQAQPFSSLSGVQMKVSAKARAITGVVRHVRGDHPVSPTVLRLYVDPDGEEGTVRPPGCTCAKAHIEINPEWVVEVLE